MRAIFLSLFLILISKVSIADDLYPYVGMPITCEFPYGKYEGVVTDMEVGRRNGGNHQYDFEGQYQVLVDHRGRSYRLERSESNRFNRTIDWVWVNEHCYSSRQDKSIMVRFFGRDGMDEEDLVECEGLRSRILELRQQDMILLDNNYLFPQSECVLIDEEASSEGPEEVVDTARDESPERGLPQEDVLNPNSTNSIPE